MANFNAQRHWWIVVVALAVVGIAGMEITDQWMPDNSIIGPFLLLGLIGAGFCWVYSIDKERLWWAIIPGLGAFTLLATLLSDILVGTDPENDWLNVLVIGIGAAIIAAVLKRLDAKQVLIIVAMFTFLVGIAMAPLTTVLKVVLIAADILVAAFILLRMRRAAANLS